MTNILSIPGVKVTQKDYHQVIIRGNGFEKFNKTRIVNLQSHYEEEVLLDLKNERTLWIGNQLYTFAKCYKISLK